MDEEAPDVVGPALWVHRGPAPPMHAPHRHDDLEVNVVLDGGLEYLFGGERVRVPSGCTAMFWAASPHRLLAREPLGGSDVCWIHVPLAVVLRWSLPEEFGARVLSHGTLVVPTAALGAHVAAQFSTWREDLAAGGDPAPVLLEANAMVLRILAQHRGGEGGPGPAGTRPDLRPVALMARFTAERFREPISTADIARAANLNPNYATTLFRRAVGATLGEQLVRHRVAEAQRLLLTTTMTTAAVAHAAGFGSQSSLYAHFTRACGCSPGTYRATRSVTAGSGAAPVSRTARRSPR
ncbi:helix-turn-helix domain-containing protein [Kineococcus indalonis]|uniref:helix-turn-helix domain-containing protein n=1 Tax=Kineococcus indalonis TaxID=2696566 RepID=UPI001411BA85|nr:helix-turn-helix domain-containing protein [Kineococcus indalonis]NAZ86371.1 helix-turn-helix domain-containing protein [Kineococcus indalonis]